MSMSAFIGMHTSAQYHVHVLYYFHLQLEKINSTTTRENQHRDNQYEMCGTMKGSPRVLHRDKLNTTKTLLSKNYEWNRIKARTRSWQPQVPWKPSEYGTSRPYWETFLQSSSYPLSHAFSSAIKSIDFLSWYPGWTR